MCNVFVKDSMFHIPTEMTTPLVMVGPGTGVVPFIGIIEDREFMKSKQNDIVFGESHLFFGCRLPDSDFIFKDIQERAIEDKLLSHLHLGFSRVMPASERNYVQDLMKKNEQIKYLIKEKNASVMICGNTKMGQDVQAWLKETLGIEVFKRLEKDKRLVKELWSN